MWGNGAHGAGRVLRWLGEAVLLLVLLLALGGLALAWRLGQGPIALPWVAHRLEAAARERGIEIAVGQVSLAWSGFRSGPDAPLELAVARVRSLATDRAGAPLLALDRAEVALSVPALLEARLVPRALLVSGVRAQLARQADGAFTLGLARDHARSLSEAARRVRAGPPKAFGNREPAFQGLRHLHLGDVRVGVFDAMTGTAFDVSAARLDLDRDAAGRLAGAGAMSLAAAGQRATLSLQARHAPGEAAEIVARLTPVDPAGIAALAPALEPFGMLDAPVSATARVAVGRDLRPVSGHLDVEIGAGTVHAGQGTAPLLSAALRLDATRQGGTASVTLRTAAGPDRPVTTLAATLRAMREGARYRAQVHATEDRIDFVDLPALWPEGTGGPGSRPWIVQNIPSGRMVDGHMDLVLSAANDLSGFAVEKIDAGLDGHDLEVHWLRPVPPMLHTEAHLSVTDPNAIDIAVISALQGGGTHGGMTYRRGTVRITGVNDPDQFADIQTELVGPVADLLATLGNPRLKLLSKRPLPMKDPAGHVTAQVHVGHLPLRDDVSMDDLVIATTARLTGVHLGGIAAGRDLSDGDLDLSANNDGLRVHGRANVAGFATALQVDMDFRAGPPDQVVQDVRVSGEVTPAALARQGIDAGGAFDGRATVQARMTTERGGAGDIRVQADATDAALRLSQLGFTKPEGDPTHGTLHVTLQGDRLASIDDLTVQGPDIDVRGRADVADGRPEVLRLARLRLGPGTDAHGVVRLPTRDGAPYQVDLAGPSLDVSAPFRAALRSGRNASAAKPGKRSRPMPAFSVRARFDRVLLGQDSRIDGFSAEAENDGHIIRSAKTEGTVRGPDVSGAPFDLAIVPQAGHRLVTARVPNLGDLLRTLGVTDSIRDGALAVDGRFDDGADAHPLAGTATLAHFRVLDAPLIARLLKAATLYGIVDLLRGPGVGFTRLVVPFRYVDGTLALHDARVVSPSLGGTVEGMIALAAGKLDLKGTVVPLYALNTLPGRLPLVGRLFSPEKSGGLFAAAFTLRGAIDQPDVSVNPLSVVAPGMLRDFFKLF